MKTILLVLALSLTLSAQALFTETFNDFYPDTAGASGAWLLSNAGALVDSIAVNKPGIFLKRGGFTGNRDTEDSPFRPSLTATDLESGDFFWGDATVGNIGATFRPDAEDYTLIVVTRFAPAYTGIPMARHAGTSYYIRHSNSANNNIGYYTLSLGTGSYQQYKSVSPNGYKSGDWNFWILSGDRDVALTLYCNGVAQVGPTGVGTWTTNGSINMSTGTDFVIGALNVSAQQPFVGDIAYAAFYKNVAFSAKRAREFGMLDRSWTSRNGRVHRPDSVDTFKFMQGLYNDTLATNIGLSTTPQIDVSFTAYSPGGGQVDIATSISGPWKSKVLTASEASYVISGLTGADSLFIRRAISDTAYVDNISISASAPGKDTTERSDRNFKKQKLYKHFKQH